MSAWQRFCPPSRVLVLVLVGCGLVGTAPGVGAADLDKIDSSLKLIPADAAFYSSMLRNREQFDIIAKSKAWARLTDMPVVQTLWKQFQDELAKQDGPYAKFEEFYKQPENRELIELLADMASHDIFLYGGEGWVPSIGLLADAYRTVQLAPLQKLTDPNNQLDEQQMQLRAFLTALSKHQDAIKVPDLIFGFKITDPKRADAQLKRLEGLLQAAVLFAPQLKDRVKREKVAGAEFIMVALDGSMIPWDQVPYKDVEQKPGEFDKLIKKLSDTKLIVSIGVRDHYVMLSVGESTAAVTRLGQGKRLVEREELKPLARFADQRLTSITYISKALAANLGGNRSDVNAMVKQVKEAVTKLNLTEAQRTKLGNELTELSKDIKSLIPEPGANLSFSFLNKRGIESYGYDWSQQLTVDGSKPLTILNHVGGNPLVASVGRTRGTLENYQKLVKWIQRASTAFEEYGLPQLGANEQAAYQQFVKVAHPLLQRFDKATGTMMLPSLADGQSGFVLDAKLASKQWIKSMPESAKPLGMLEPALIFGLSDANLFEKALGEYRTLLNDVLLLTGDFDVTKNVANVRLPEPQSTKLTRGTMYSYLIPAEAGLDARILPNAAVSDKWAAFTISRVHSERLLANTPLKVEDGPLANYATRNLAGASYVHWAGMVDAITPWIEYGLDAAGPALALFAGPQGVEGIAKQVRTGAEILKVLRSHTSCTYFEDKALVTHSETVYVDLK
jgi:hypothetical protein